MDVADLVLDLLAIHFCEGKVAQNTPQILSIDIATVIGVVECEGIFDLIFLNQ